MASKPLPGGGIKRDRKTARLIERLDEAAAAYERIISGVDNMSDLGKANACALTLTLFGHLFGLAAGQIRDLTRK